MVTEISQINGNSSKKLRKADKSNNGLFGDIYFRLYASFAIMTIFFLLGLIIFLFAQINRIVCKRAENSDQNDYKKKLRRLKGIECNFDLKKLRQLLVWTRNKPKYLPKVNDECLKNSVKNHDDRVLKRGGNSTQKLMGVRKKSINKIKLKSRVIFYEIF